MRIALDVATVADAAPGPRAEQVLVLLSASCGELGIAVDLDRRLARGAMPAAPERSWRKVEAALEKRSISLSGDPYFGLLLHNGSVFADAHLFGRLAIDFFARGALHLGLAERRCRFAAQQKALLLEVLTALACVERKPSIPTRRAILRQLQDLQLPQDLASELKRRLKRTFERRPRLGRILLGVRSRELRRFILEQTLLASLVEGRRSLEEVAFLHELAERLHFTPEEVGAFEIELAEFYARNRDVIDVFTVSPGAEALGEEWVDSMQEVVEKNFYRLVQEARETGELSVLLTRAARGQPLSPDERRRMREQLIDIAKAIPALAIFAAPGGVLLLIALAKVLPFSILPSAFQEAADDEPSLDQSPARRRRA